MLQNKKTTADRALEHFDDFYGSVYGNRWKSIRVALLTEHKYVALVNNFGDTDEIITTLESNGKLQRTTFSVFRIPPAFFGFNV